MLNYFIEKNYKSNRWLKRYLLFVDTFQLSQSIKNETHNHHILPVALFPEFKSFIKNPFNKAILSHRSHLIAHYMLAKALGDKMWFAYNNMNAHNVKLSTKLYETAQKEVGVAQSIRQTDWLKNHPHPKGMKGKKHSQETKDKLASKNTGKKQSQKTIDKRIQTYTNKSQAEKDYLASKISQRRLGQTHSEETKQMISDKAKERYANGFEIILTEEQIKKQKDSLKKYYMENDHHTKGKTYEEIMGREKAEKIKKDMIENNPSKTREARDKISAFHKGKVLSEKTKDLLRNKVPITKDGKNKRVDKELLEQFLSDGWVKGQTRIPEEKFECPHCHKMTNKGNLKRWHGDNCKLMLS